MLFFNLKNRAMDAEQEAAKAFKQIDTLKKKHEIEISTFNEFIAKSRLPLEAIQPTCNDNAIPIDEDTKGPSLSINKFGPVCNEEEREFAKSKEHSWFSGYDKCNI